MGTLVTIVVVALGSALTAESATRTFLQVRSSGLIDRLKLWKNNDTGATTE